MAENILKLKVASEEYDAKIKRAAEGIQHFVQNVRESGSTLKESGILARSFLTELGNMETVAKGGKQQLREMSNAIVTLTNTYRGLSDADKASGFGQELNRQIQVLTERAGTLQDSMADVQASIQHAASDTRAFDQIAGAAGLATSSFQTLQGSAKLMGIEMGNDVEVIAKLQAAMAVTNGLTQIQTALQSQSALMQGVQAVQAAAAAAAQTSLAGATGAATIAQRAFNAVANANPYVLLATAAAAVTAAYIAWTSGARDAEKAQKALNTEIDSTKSQLSQIDKDTDFSVGIAEAAGKSWKAIHELRLEAARTKLQLADMNYDKLVARGNASAEQIKQAVEMQQKAWDDVMKVLNEGTIHDVKMRNGGGKTKTTKSTKSTQDNEHFAANSIMAQEKWIAKLEDEWKRAGESVRDEYIPMIEMAKKKLEEMKGTSVKTETKASIPQMATGLSGFNEQTINAWTSMIKSDLAKADIGSEVYNSLMDNLSDMSRLTTTVKDALKLGLEIPQETVENLYDTIFDGGNMPEDMYGDMIQKFIEDFRDATGQELVIGENGSLSEKKSGGNAKGDDEFKKFTDDVNKLTGGLSNVTNGLKSIGVSIPKEVDDVIGVINGVSQVISGVQTVISVLAGSSMNANTVAVSANTAAIGGLIAALEMNTYASFFGLAGGGMPWRGNVIHAAGGTVVPGNYGYDAVPAMLTSGEVVLNHAQVGNLAANLERGSMQNLNIDWVMKGEDMRAVINTNGRRTGRGEIVQRKRR